MLETVSTASLVKLFRFRDWLAARKEAPADVLKEELGTLIGVGREGNSFYSVFVLKQRLFP